MSETLTVRETMLSSPVLSVPNEVKYVIKREVLELVEEYACSV